MVSPKRGMQQAGQQGHGFEKLLNSAMCCLKIKPDNRLYTNWNITIGVFSWLAFSTLADP
jgi:hypothetical protein